MQKLPPKKPGNKLPPPPSAPVAKKVQTKKFIVEPWQSAKEGERIIICGVTGIGKSSLAFLAPKPVFIGLDESGRKLKDSNGKPPNRIPDVETFEDVRSALQQVDLFNPYKTIVVDTVTTLEDWAEPYVVATIKTDKGATVKNILGYGYNKGYKHLYNTMKLILQDCDGLIRHGKNVILIAQAALHNIPNPSGEDFLRAGLRLHVDKTWDIESLYCEWADDILRIDYHNAFVSSDKKISGDTMRAVFVQPELYFRAKMRSPIIDTKGNSVIEVSFENKDDSSIWDFIFNGEE